MKYGSISFTGKSGERYRFDAWSLDTRFRARGAVYFVTRRQQENATYSRASHDRIFIGHTADLAGQYDTYSQSERFAKHGANCICILLIEDEEQRIAVANDLLGGPSTHCNNHPLSGLASAGATTDSSQSLAAKEYNSGLSTDG